MSKLQHGVWSVAILSALAFVPRAHAQVACALPDPFPTCGGSDVTVARDATMTLAAGTYAAVRVRNGGALILRDGAYVFCSLHVSRNASLLFGAATTIRVAGDVSFGNA